MVLSGALTSSSVKIIKIANSTGSITYKKQLTLNSATLFLPIFWIFSKFSQETMLHISVGFISRSCFDSDGFIAYSNEWDWREKQMMFIYTNQPLIISFFIKKVPIFAELAMSQCWFAIFCITGVWGGKPNGRVRVNWIFKNFSL